jgi:hypothetical protein
MNEKAPSNDADELVGASYVQELFGVHRATVARWAESGRLQMVGRIGGNGTLVFRKVDIQALKDQIESERQESRTA